MEKLILCFDNFHSLNHQDKPQSEPTTNKQVIQPTSGLYYTCHRNTQCSFPAPCGMAWIPGRLPTSVSSTDAGHWWDIPPWWPSGSATAARTLLSRCDLYFGSSRCIAVCPCRRTSCRCRAFDNKTPTISCTSGAYFKIISFLKNPWILAATQDYVRVGCYIRLGTDIQLVE